MDKNLAPIHAKMAYVCSKYRAKNEVEMQQHIMDAMEACRAVHERGDIPVAPHLYWPRFLDEGNPEDRDYGLQAGMEALKRCDQMVVIIRQEGPEDEWISQGMQAEITAAAKMGIEPQFIYIGKAGYSPRKTLKYMADNGLIATASEGSDSKQRYSVKRRFDGRSCRFVEFKIGQFSEKDDDIESEADKYEQESFTGSDGFMSIPEGMEEELPFK